MGLVEEEPGLSGRLDLAVAAHPVVLRPVEDERAALDPPPALFLELAPLFFVLFIPMLEVIGEIGDPEVRRMSRGVLRLERPHWAS